MKRAILLPGLLLLGCSLLATSSRVEAQAVDLNTKLRAQSPVPVGGQTRAAVRAQGVRARADLIPQGAVPNGNMAGGQVPGQAIVADQGAVTATPNVQYGPQAPILNNDGSWQNNIALQNAAAMQGGPYNARLERLYRNGGIDPNGYSPNGYNPNGYNPNGHRYGVSPTGYNPSGYNMNAYPQTIGYNLNGIPANTPINDTRGFNRGMAAQYGYTSNGAATNSVNPGAVYGPTGGGTANYPAGATSPNAAMWNGNYSQGAATSTVNPGANFFPQRSGGASANPGGFGTPGANMANPSTAPGTSSAPAAAAPAPAR